MIKSQSEERHRVYFNVTNLVAKNNSLPTGTAKMRSTRKFNGKKLWTSKLYHC